MLLTCAQRKTNNCSLAWPEVCNQTIFVNNRTNTTDIVDINIVNKDNNSTEDGSKAVDDKQWLPLPLDKNGDPYNVVVKPRKDCYHWKFERIAFQVKNAAMFRIRIGTTYDSGWVG